MQKEMAVIQTNKSVQSGMYAGPIDIRPNRDRVDPMKVYLALDNANVTVIGASSISDAKEKLKVMFGVDTIESIRIVDISSVRTDIESGKPFAKSF